MAKVVAAPMIKLCGGYEHGFVDISTLFFVQKSVGVGVGLCVFGADQKVKPKICEKIRNRNERLLDLLQL